MHCSCKEKATIYLAIPLRNTGSGLAQLHGYRLDAEQPDRVQSDPLGPAQHRRGGQAPESATFLQQQRDLYIASGEIGFWQAALRDPSSPTFDAVQRALDTRGRLTVDVLYGDLENEQRTITRLRAAPKRRWVVALRRCSPLDRRLVDRDCREPGSHCPAGAGRWRLAGGKHRGLDNASRRSGAGLHRAKQVAPMCGNDQEQSSHRDENPCHDHPELLPLSSGEPSKCSPGPCDQQKQKCHFGNRDACVVRKRKDKPHARYLPIGSVSNQ